MSTAGFTPGPGQPYTNGELREGEFGSSGWWGACGLGLHGEGLIPGYNLSPGALHQVGYEAGL